MYVKEHCIVFVVNMLTTVIPVKHAALKYNYRLCVMASKAKIPENIQFQHQDFWWSMVNFDILVNNNGERTIVDVIKNS